VSDNDDAKRVFAIPAEKLFKASIFFTKWELVSTPAFNRCAPTVQV
jgi:hypothetical protein